MSGTTAISQCMRALCQSVKARASPHDDKGASQFLYPWWAALQDAAANEHGARQIPRGHVPTCRDCAAFIARWTSRALTGSVCELPNARNPIRTVAGVAGTFYRLRRNI